MFSFLLPLLGLVITASEVMRLIDVQRAADACLAQTQEPTSCPPGPDPLFFVAAAVFALIFTARIVYLAYQYLRSER